MDLKRIFRGWVLAILLVVIVFLFVFRLAGSSQTYQQVDTSPPAAHGFEQRRNGTRIGDVSHHRQGGVGGGCREIRPGDGLAQRILPAARGGHPPAGP